MAKAAPPYGELVLIEQLRGTFPQHRPGGTVALGIGDDCAILRPPKSSDVLVTTDFSLEGRHFERGLHPPESVGHRCLARGLSDLAAMGAKPMAAFLSLALPAELVNSLRGRRWVERFFHGMKELATQFRITLAGGDTSQSPSGGGVLADIILLGTAPRCRALRRSGARAGDLIYVTGALGGAAAELEIMVAGNALPTKKKRMTGPHPHMFPEPRIAVGQALLRRRLATACIDLSDGLSSDLAHLCRESDVGAEIETSALPVHTLAGVRDSGAALKLALHGGEDYELLFAARPKTRVPRQLAGVPITLIGRATAKRRGMVLIDSRGSKTVLRPGGWEHFA